MSGGMRQASGPRKRGGPPSLGAAVLAFLLATSLQGQDPQGWVDQTRLTGDWDGARTTREQSGFTIAFQYYTNLAGNPVGGRAQGFTYTDSLNLKLDFDMDRLVSWKGGLFHVTFTNRDGSSLTANYIGNIFTVQQIYGPTETYRLTEMTIEQSFDGGVWDVRAGRYPAAEFATSSLYCVFMNNGFCGYPGGVAQNLNMPYFPVPSWAGRVRWKPRPELLAQVGVFEVNPTLADTHGFDWSTSGSTGTAVVGELWYVRGDGAPGLPGHYKLGGWYQSIDSSATDQSGFLRGIGEPAAFARRTLASGSEKGGVYALVDQNLVAGEAGTGTGGAPSGLSVLGGASWAQGPTTTNDFAAFGGLIANGMISCRPFDTQGFAFTWANFTAPGQTYELVLEWNYGIAVTRWFTFQPDFQWVIRPGATGQIPNALVIGAQAVLNF